MATKWTIALACSVAILGMFLPFYSDKMLAGLPTSLNLTGAAMFGQQGIAAEHAMTLAKGLAYFVWLIPFSAALTIFAIAVGPVPPALRAVIGVLWLVVVLVVPTVSVDIGLEAARPLFPQLPKPPAWIGLGVGGWPIVLAALAMIVSAFVPDKPASEPTSPVTRA